MQGSAVYSPFNFAKMFLPIREHPDEKQKSAFPGSTYQIQCTYVPCGLSHAADEVQQRVNQDFLGPTIKGWMALNMDDILVRSHMQENLHHHRGALQLQCEKQWFVRARNVLFHATD